MKKSQSGQKQSTGVTTGTTEAMAQAIAKAVLISGKRPKPTPRCHQTSFEGM